ncbi:Peptide deformylase [Labeo rohita]|uniref:Peptide deformylase n=1 Tax=Labeo rohita TaxID=84645 RepID=A0ABQ8MUZ7_LABRO|nr:Peptide deformylase [Labeo rohita]
MLPLSRSLSLSLSVFLSGGPALNERAVKFRSKQKYVKLSDFLDEAFVKSGISVSSRPEARLYDESGTEIDEDVCEDILKQPNLELTHVPPVPSEESSIEISSNESDDTILLSDDSLTRKRRAEDEAGIVNGQKKKSCSGDGIIREYNKTKCLSDSNRRKMVNIFTADMTEKHSSSPPKQVRELYAQLIIALFPYLRDPYSTLGYVMDKGTCHGKLRTFRRTVHHQRPVDDPQSFSGGPSAQREASSSTEVILTEEQYREAVSLMMHTSEEATVKVKMRETFQYRRKMIHDPSRCTDVLTEFPRYLDIKGLVRTFELLILSWILLVFLKFLERWPTTFMQKVILIHCAESAVDTESDEDGWGSGLASILLLLHLIPPSAQDHKRSGKMSASQAEKHIVILKKVNLAFSV